MTISYDNKCKIISQVAHILRDYPLLEDFFNYNDVGIPLAQALNYGLCVLTEEGEEAIQETWEFLCVLGQKDPNANNYESIDDILDIEDDQ